MTQTQSDDLVTRLLATVDTGDMMFSRMTPVNPDGPEAAAEIQRLQAQVAVAREALVVVTDSLEAELNARYSETLPALQRSYNRDMEDVVAARAALASIEGAAS